LHQESQPDEKTWTGKEGESACSVVSNPFTGRMLRCATPVYVNKSVAGAVVTDLKLHELLSEVAQYSESNRSTEQTVSGPTQVVVLDQSGEIVYHTNNALRHQQVRASFAEFEPVAGPMMSGQSGVRTFDSGGSHWLAVFAPLSSAGLSLAIARNSSLDVGDARKWGLVGLGLAILLGLGTAGILATQYQRKSRGIERVAQDVAAIAKGELDHEVDVRSREDMRPLADNVNIVTKRLREQIARESETRQFQSFVRLSAVLTHDLKNAIGGLSLLVSNMDEHYSNEEFRADAMNSLTNATQKLKSLVDRISNPVTTLSGEYKLPAPVDLIPMIKRIVPQTIGRVSGTHHLEMELPSSLVALVDAERMEKVLENLVLNALEAMHGNTGTLRIEGGKEPDGKVFLTVADTGIGMSKPFIDEKLFHAFATTKKNGMGLGLYTCREVVMANGGTIEVTSKQGDGTTFRVVLPAAPLKG
jgi:signal transduction histidine kinase